MNFFITIIFISLFFRPAFANSGQYNINPEHLKSITDDEGTYIPVKAQSIPATAEEKDRGIKGRLLISWGKLQTGDFNTTYHRYDENGNETSDSDVNNINQQLKDNLELQNSHLISVEYFVTDNLSIEVADDYREYSMRGEMVGEMSPNSGQSFLFGGSQTASPYEINQHDNIHNFEVGLNYSVRLVETNYGTLEVALKGSAGLVHLDTTTTVNYETGGSDNLYDYNGLAGYSYGGGVKARYSYKKVFVQAGADYRQYVIAPTKNKDGSSQEIHQEGAVFYISVGLRF